MAAQESLSTKAEAMQLAAQVAARRISNVISQANGSRVMYAIVDVGRELTSAIGLALADLSSTYAKVEVAIHPELAVDGLEPKLQTSEVATRFRNHKDDGVVATIFSVPVRQMEGVLQSLGSVERINQPWLCDPAKADLWASETLQNHIEEIVKPFERILRGLMESGILASADMLASFCAEVREAMTGPSGLPLIGAVNRALPALRLPRYCAPEMKLETLADRAAVQYRHWRDEFRPHLYLEARDGQVRPRQELLTRLGDLKVGGVLAEDAASALEDLVNDLGLTAGVWRESQQKVADLPWADVSAFFRKRTRKPTNTLGTDTVRYLDDEYPTELSEKDRKVLEDVRRETDDATPEQEAVFLRYRERLSATPKLYKRWERFVFDKPLNEDDDLLTGLLRLAQRACQNADDVEDPVLLVRLRGAEKMSFWTGEKNSDLCMYLRDRYRGLENALSPWAQLDFGRCWKGDWEGRVERNEKGTTNAEFEFEAFVVQRAALRERESGQGLWSEHNKAQMVWKPGHTTFATAVAEDLRRVLGTGQDRAFLLRAQVSAARSSRGMSSQRVTIEKVTSITDSLGQSQGALANPVEQPSVGVWNRIDELWRQRIEEHVGGELSTAEADELQGAFEEFHSDYTTAIKAMTAPDGEGLASAALLCQAGSYGRLLDQLRHSARADILVRDLWEPLLQVGMATVTGDTQAMIVTPWHPLRLAELAVKARQAASMIEKIVTSPGDKTADVERYVNDRVQALKQTYYANVGLARTETGVRLLMETEARSGYSLLEPPFSENEATLADEPVDHAVEKFGEISAHYLKQRPHERANFSTVLLDAESEDLPRLVAKYLAEKMEDEADLRCDFSVSHEDPRKLRQIYERQNRHIGDEVETSLTSEAGRIFLSRLRVGIASPESLVSADGARRQDIVLLHDVIARQARVTWHEATDARGADELLYHVPTDISRRKSQSSGGLSASVYLTSPSQVAPSQAYLDAMHDVWEGRAFGKNTHFVPAQRVELGSPLIAKKLVQAHAMANWVITYDRIADRRLIARSDSRLRILRYFSAPRSFHNVIVSTEVSRDQLRDRLQENLEHILPGGDKQTLERLVAAIHRRSTSLSGSIVMRGAQWDNYARELIGLIVAQRELELLLSGGGDHRTAAFFLDEFRGWLDLSGEISDILAVDLEASADAEPRVRLVIVEAKCVGQASVHESQKRSWTQMEGTYTAIVNRFAATGTTVDPAIWRHRLADMLVEHMDPWSDRESVAGMVFDEWVDAIRGGRVTFEVTGHSIVSVHDMDHSAEDLNLRIADTEVPRRERRRLAQWRLGADCIAKSVRGIADDHQSPQLHEPDGWPQILSTGGREPPAPQHRPPRAESKGRPASKVKTPVGDAGEGRGRIASQAPNTPEPLDKSSGGSRALNELSLAAGERAHDTPSGWKSTVHDAVVAMQRPKAHLEGQKWLEQVVERFKQAVQAEDMEAPVDSAVLTPNSALLHVAGRRLTVKWLEGKRTDLMTRYGVEILRITPMAGRIAVALKRPKRGVLHLSDVWTRRALEASAPTKNMAFVIGEQEDDGELFYLSLENDFAGREQAAPHTLISGTTGSGKGILVSNLILDVCAFNDPRSVQIYLIDPKRGADYVWAQELPHLHDGIVDEKNVAIELLRLIVGDMEERYRQITGAKCANIEQYNRRVDAGKRLPRVVIFFDEVANWMQDDDFKNEVNRIINQIATKARAAGFHLIMIYQRADKDVMSMQLRTNLGNKVILRLGDEGSSRIALGEKGAERLLGRGHVIAKLGSDEKIYGQVPFIEQDEARILANAIAEAWGPRPP